MTLSIDITDDKQLVLIEQLRGDRPSEEYARIVFTAGLQLAAFQRQQHIEAEKKGQLVRFSSAKPEFKTLDAAAILEALKDSNPQNPIKLEVGRLVREISGQLHIYAQNNGNKHPDAMRISAGVPIERIAFQITQQALKQTAATKAANG